MKLCNLMLFFPFCLTIIIVFDLIKTFITLCCSAIVFFLYLTISKNKMYEKIVKNLK